MQSDKINLNRHLSQALKGLAFAPQQYFGIATGLDQKPEITGMGTIPVEPVPSWPYVLSPQTYQTLPTFAIEEEPKARISVAPVNCTPLASKTLTATGLSLLLLMPSPSCPKKLYPQAQT